jgi:hypothetical protein
MKWLIAIMMVGLMAVPAIAQDGVTYTKDEDRYISNEVVESCRSVVTGERFNPEKTVYVFWHGNGWGKNPNHSGLVEMEKTADGYWKAPGMAGKIFNVGQYVEKNAPAWPDNIKWPALEQFGGANVDGVISFDGNLCFAAE